MYKMPANSGFGNGTKNLWKIADKKRPTNTSSKTNNTASTDKSVSKNITENLYSMNSLMEDNLKDNNGALDFSNLSQKRLQEAIIWSEILGKPMCKRRERR
jgi:hypothetical protein